MTPTALIEHLDAIGVTLWVDGETLRFRAPEGALTVDLRNRIKDSRAQIMDLLRHRGQDQVRRDPDGAHDPFPLTDVQGSYLVGRTSAFSDGGVGCHGYAEFDVDPTVLGEDPVGRLRDAWRQVVDCHPMLRAIVHSEGWQQVVPDLEVPLRVRSASDRETVREQLQTRTHPVVTGSITDVSTLEPLIDVVVTVGVEDIVLHVSVDLLLTDFIGLGVILGDLASVLSGRPVQPPSLTFRDYLATVREQAASPRGRAEHDRAEKFWSERATTLAEPITLSPESGDPTAPTGHHDATIRFTRRSHHLSDEQWQGVETAARDGGVTTTSLLVAGVARVLHRHGGPDRGLVAMTLADRKPVVPDVNRIVGDFTSTLLVEVDGRADVSLTELAATAQEATFEALQHNALSGVELSRLIAAGQGGERFQVPVVITSTIGAGAAVLPDPVLRPRPGHGLSQTPQVLLDIQFSPVPGQGGVSIDWDSRDGGISATVLDAAFADFSDLVDTISRHGIPATDPLRRRAPAAIERTGRLDVLPATLHEPLIARWREDPTAPAVIDGDHVVSRGQLMAAATTVSRHVLTAGGAPRVAVVLPPGAAQVAVELGVLLAGGCYVPLEPDWPEARRQAVLEVLRREGETMLIDSGTELMDELHEVLRGRADRPVELPSGTVPPDAEAYVIFTSGSTGHPKGVVVTHRQARTTLADLEARLGLGSTDAVLAVSRHSFDLSVFNMFGILGVGGRMVIPTSGTTADPSAWAASLVEHRVSVWNSVPAQLQLLLDHLEGRQPTAELALRVVLVSGDWVPVGQPAQTWRHAPNTRFWALGGATEAAIWSVLNEVTAPLPETARSVPYGTAMDDQGIWVLNAEDEPATIGQIGDIVIGGDGVAAGYLGDPGLTAAAFFTHPATGERCYRTGDRGRMLPDGRIEFLGRIDGQVKIRGHRIELGEIESVLGAIPGVARAVAAVNRSGSGSGTLVAAVLPETGDHHALFHAERAAAVTGVMSAADRDFTAGLDVESMLELAALVEESALHRMAVQVARGEGHGMTGLIDTLGAGRHADLVQRWVAMLCERGWVSMADQTVQLLRTPDVAEEKARWDRIQQLDRHIGYGSEHLAYVRRCLDELPGLLRGDVDPLALLFPEGNTHVARAAYGENLFARWINTVVATGIAELARRAEEAGRTLRVLEIGGGVGGTTDAVLEALGTVLGNDLTGVDYLFTDVSRFFFEEVTTRWPSLRTGLFDINSPDGVVPGSVDVILSANVLHNARHIPQVLEGLAGLLVPGGVLAAIDSTVVNPTLMTTMEFKEGLSDFTDLRNETGKPFLDLTEWVQVLAESPFTLAGCFPEGPDHPMRIGNQHALWATTGGGQAPLDPDRIIAHLASTLPHYMVPRTVAILDSLPLTANGKIDRARVAALTDQPGLSLSTSSTATELDPCQQRVAAIWQEVLGLPGTPLHPGSNFFDLGGDSLLLARSIGRLRRELPGGEAVAWDDALRRIVADPTIAGCARTFTSEEDTGPGGAAQSAVTELLPADGVGDEVLVLVHDGSGGLAPYQDVIEVLRRTTPRPRVLGLRRTTDDGYLETPPAELLDQLSDRYATELISLGVSRVQLFGYCMGGLIAAGVATRLAEADIEVTGCTVVSSYRIPFAVEDELMLDHSFAKLLHLDPADAGIDVDEHALGRALTEVRRHSPTRIAPGAIREVAEPELAAALDRAPADSGERLRRLAVSDPRSTWTPETLALVKEVFRQSMAAVAQWDAPAYLGDICFLRQRGDLHFLPTLREDMTDFWSTFCLGELDVQDIEGTHFDCLGPDNADGVVTILNRRWER
ncbi:amino acid adenylation domain-containing protein [Arachnia propionica]|uniref:Amino acid adenylation domain-containing protein n=1 Tax=Arachnia propionica TaxID=1750 RepID=A0A3P1T9A5_9ACTN|nr:non-ribosomal peptide synthetase [Arachnia propionica]RRD06032.1 amino acid adenylation domain-containing protein [Arachnia propionica]